MGVFSLSNAPQRENSKVLLYLHTENDRCLSTGSIGKQLTVYEVLFYSIKKHKYLKNAYKIKKEQISFLKVNYEYRISILNQLVSYSYSSPQLSPHKAPLHINQPCARSGEVHLNCIVTKVTSARMSAAWLAMSPLAALPQTSMGPLMELRVKLPSHLS